MITTSYKNYYVIITYILTYIIFERLLKVTKTEKTTGLFNPSMSSVQRAKSPVDSGSDVLNLRHMGNMRIAHTHVISIFFSFKKL